MDGETSLPAAPSDGNLLKDRAATSAMNRKPQPIESQNGAAAFVQSALFGRTFREGMDLVEETADYLDGEGREASKLLNRDLAMAYAGASMRLTTQLMQIASWLLVLRAVRENEMKLGEASEPKYRIEAPGADFDGFHADGLPDRLTALIDQTRQLYGRIARLDADIFGRTPDANNPGDAAGQQRALLAAFAEKARS